MPSKYAYDKLRTLRDQMRAELKTAARRRDWKAIFAAGGIYVTPDGYRIGVLTTRLPGVVVRGPGFVRYEFGTVAQALAWLDGEGTVSFAR